MLPAKRTIFRAATRAAIHAKCGGRCAYCGVPIDINRMAIDHIHPRSCGGTNDHGNLNPSCRACNNFKAVWSLEEFRRHLSQQVDRCRKYSVNFRNAERFGMVRIVGTEVKFYFERLQDSAGGSQS